MGCSVDFERQPIFWKKVAKDNLSNNALHSFILLSLLVLPETFFFLGKE